MQGIRGDLRMGCPGGEVELRMKAGDVLRRAKEIHQKMLERDPDANPFEALNNALPHKASTSDSWELNELLDHCDLDLDEAIALAEEEEG